MKCKAIIQPAYDGSSRGRCSRNATIDGYCKQHAPKDTFANALRKVVKEIEKNGLQFTDEEKRQFLQEKHADQIARLANFTLGKEPK